MVVHQRRNLSVVQRGRSSVRPLLFLAALLSAGPARIANSGLMDLNPVGIYFQRRQARHSCSIQNQTRFQDSSGGRAPAPEYAAPTGLGNGVARAATKISLQTKQFHRLSE